MPGVFRRKPFAFEHVAQVRAAIGANNFHATAIGIQYAIYRAGYLIIKTRPAAPGIELLRTREEVLGATTAAEDTVGVDVQERSGERNLGGRLTQDGVAIGR